MRTLLFVQNGDARPICVRGGFPASHLGDPVAWVRESLMPTAIGARLSDRWWLVECHNAEEGRELIYLRMAITAAHRYMGNKNPEQGTAAVCGSVPAGRILASGAREVA